MKVIYLYTSHGAAPTNSIADNWRPPAQCGQQYDSVHGDGVFKLLGELHKNGVIDDLRVFYESNRDPGKAQWIPGVYCCVVPEIRFVAPFIKEDTIIFARGGFRGWHDFLHGYKGKNWLMLYPANTGRERWPWWDVILEDRQRANVVDKCGRYWNFFIKPTDEGIFHPTDQKIKYDLCIGASHIHDKKGQWRTIEALVEYKRLYGNSPRCILPGAARKGVRSSSIINRIKQHALDVSIPGEVTKEGLCQIFNESKFFIHLGTHGQNDRGPIEALACGTPLIIGSPQYHSPIINEVSFIPPDINDFTSVAKEINRLLRHYHKVGSYPYMYYRANHSFDQSYERMEILLKKMAGNQPGLLAKHAIRSAFESV